MAGTDVVESVVVVPPLMGMPRRRPLDRAEGLLAGGLVLVIEVAKRWFGDHGVDALNLVPRVDRRVDSIRAERNRHDVHLLGDRRRSVATHLAKFPTPHRFRIGSG